MVVASVLTRHHPECFAGRRKKEIPMKTPDQHHFAKSLDTSVLPAVVDRATQAVYWYQKTGSPALCVKKVVE
jgi:hypothetical protein